jgi:hypothetical protein
MAGKLAVWLRPEPGMLISFAHQSLFGVSMLAQRIAKTWNWTGFATHT